ncbi:MAG: hypothetical protein ACMG6S_00515 [Byssovorax sp.]
MLRTIKITAALACAAMLTGCAADTTTPDQEPADARAEQADTRPQAFVIHFDDSTTPESVIPAIVAAAHDQLVTACEGNRGASVRVFNPLASGSYEDIQCSDILGGSEVIGQASAPVANGGERIGQVQQKWSPVGLVCGALMLGAALAWNWPGSHAGCNDPRAENPVGCQRVTTIGIGSLGFLCGFI